MAKSPSTNVAGARPATASNGPEAAEQAEVERVAAEQAEAERLAAEQAEVERLAAEHGGFDMAGRMILVRSISRLGRRRAGIAFGPEATLVAIDDLTEDQLAAILGDSDHLVVQLEA